MGQGCVFVSMCVSTCVSSNGKISRWLVYITLSVEILCGPFFSLLAPGMGRGWNFDLEFQSLGECMVQFR